MATLFYQPSTRTRLSFESAATRMGMGMISTENARDFSSAAKGETIEDTVRVVEGYADVIVMRHPKPNSVQRAADVAETAVVINAGDGGHEHPTQAVLDTYTIRQLKDGADGLKVAFGGDLRYGRTVRSLVDILSRVYQGNSFSFIAPEPLQVTDDILDKLRQRGDDFSVTDNLEEGLAGADVVYWTRLQTENIEAEVDKLIIQKAIEGGDYILGRAAVKYMNPEAVILHPLPRVGEISTKLDDSSHLHIFDQAHNGVPVRQALLDMIIEELSEGEYRFRTE